MKKTFLLKTMLLLCALIVGGSAWAQSSTDCYTATSNDKPTATNGTTTGNVTGTNSISWSYSVTQETASGKSPYTAYSADYGWQLGSGNSPCKAFSISTSGIIGTITKIEVETGSKDASSSISVTVGGNAFGGDAQATGSGSTVTTQTFNGNASGTIVISASASSAAFYFKSVTVTYTSTKVAAPSFNPAGGDYSAAQSVELSSTTTGASIHYTMTIDGTTPADPTESDATYSSAISVTKNGTIIKAKAFKSGLTASNVSSATYNIKPQTPNILVVGTTVTILGSTGCSFYYLTYTDPGSTLNPSNQSTLYNGAFTPTEDCYIKAIAYDTYGNASDVTSAVSFKYMPLAPKNISSNYFMKVTNADDLENGDAILIVNENKGKAISTTQNNNNRGSKDVTISPDGIIGGISTEVQKLVLVKKTETITINNNDVETDVFYFYTGEAGYLYASSSNNNYLKTEVTPDYNARATISISDGDATITFRGTSTHNLLQYNSSSSIFSAYGNAQQAVQIYKEIPYTAPITTAGWATYKPTYAVEFQEGTNAYIVSGANATTATLQQVTSVPANTPVLLQGTEGTATTTAMSVLLSSTTDVSSNCLHVSDGTAASTTTDPIYVLSKPTGEEVGFYKWAVGTTLPAGKIYLQLSSDVRSFIALPGEETGISATLMNNEQRINNNVYDLQGRPVAQPTKGLYIVNGKKVIIK